MADRELRLVLDLDEEAVAVARLRDVGGTLIQLPLTISTTNALLGNRCS
jgi:hypothetical protein